MPQPAELNTRWRLLLLVASMLILIAVFVAADFQKASTTLTVQVGGQQAVQIDLNQHFAISPYLLGSNVFPETGTVSRDQRGGGFMSYDAQVILGLRSANIKLLRFPGGNWGEEHIPSMEQLNSFNRLLNQVGADGIMQVPLSDLGDKTPVSLQTRASRAVLLVDYMNNRQSIQRTDANAAFHRITYWTIGNEPDLLINPDTKAKYTVAEYTVAFISYSLAMHQKDPSIKIFGPEISQYLGEAGPKDARGNLWMDGFLTGISTYEHTHSLPFRVLDGVSLHSYPFGDIPVDVSALLNNPTNWDAILSSLHQLIRQDFGEDLPVAITEINTNSAKNLPPQHLAATWWADTLGELMSNQVEYIAFFSTEGVDIPYPLFVHKDLKETAMLRAMQLFAQLQQNLVPIQREQGPINIYATQDRAQNTVSMLFLNKTNGSQHVSIHTASVLPFGRWQDAELTIQGYSMMVLTLHQGGGNETFSFSNPENVQQDLPSIQHVVCGRTRIVAC